METSSEESKDSELELAIYDDQVKKDDITLTLKRDFNVDDLITHDEDEKLFNVPQRNKRREARLNADSETYQAEMVVVKQTLKMRSVEGEIADLEEKLRQKQE